MNIGKEQRELQVEPVEWPAKTPQPAETVPQPAEEPQTVGTK